MKRFIIKLVLISFLFLLVAELVSRVVIDPYYYYTLDTYNLRKDKPSLSDIYKHEDTENVDYLFIGSSRVPATIMTSDCRGLGRNTTPKRSRS